MFSIVKRLYGHLVLQTVTVNKNTFNQETCILSCPDKMRLAIQFRREKLWKMDEETNEDQVLK